METFFFQSRPEALPVYLRLREELMQRWPETVIEVIAFALARQLIVGHAAPLENLITIVAIAILFAVRRFFLNRHDLVETPDGLVGCDDEDEEQA